MIKGIRERYRETWRAWLALVEKRPEMWIMFAASITFWVWMIAVIVKVMVWE